MSLRSQIKPFKNIMECPYDNCRNSLRPWNAATNFANPTHSVEYAVSTNIISPGQYILEFGGENLRNALFVMSKLPTAKYYVVEKTEGADRFRSRYEEFERRGGHLVQGEFRKRHFDIVVCTFVLETICPSSQRTEVLRSLRKALKSGGSLIASFRGYPGVKGTKYKKCPAEEGYITPFKTFIKPYSITEVQDLLKATGFIGFETLQKYRVESPQNIHIRVRV